VEFFFKTMNEEDEDDFVKLLKKVYDLNFVLKRFYNVTANYEEWKKLIYTF